MIPEFEAVLIVTIPNQVPRCYRIDGVQTQIGRSRNNHLVLDDQAVSNIHCEFIKDSITGRCIFRDLGSTNGSRVNGQLVDWDVVAVKDGDEIVLGNVIKLHYLWMHEMENPESLEEEEEDPDVNPVAAAMARQVREDMEGTQVIKIKAEPRRK